MSVIRSVAVFCGSRAGDQPVYREAARALGEGLARSGIALVFGGGRVGLMGALADAALMAGGRVIGVIPDFLTRREVAHPGLSELVVTETMHARKRRMFELSDAFVCLPGGLGTFDETIEIITWRQLELHAKPVLVCNVAGSAEPLLAMIEAAIETGFAAASARALYERVEGVPALLARLGQLGASSGGEAARL